MTATEIARTAAQVSLMILAPSACPPAVVPIRFPRVDTLIHVLPNSDSDRMLCRSHARPSYRARAGAVTSGSLAATGNPATVNDLQPAREYRIPHL